MIPSPEKGRINAPGASRVFVYSEEAGAGSQEVVSHPFSMKETQALPARAPDLLADDSPELDKILCSAPPRTLFQYGPLPWPLTQLTHHAPPATCSPAKERLWLHVCLQDSEG